MRPVVFAAFCSHVYVADCSQLISFWSIKFITFEQKKIDLTWKWAIIAPASLRYDLNFLSLIYYSPFNWQIINIESLYTSSFFILISRATSNP